MTSKKVNKVEINSAEDVMNAPFPTRLLNAELRMIVHMEAQKIFAQNELTIRDRFAKEIMAGICAGDWKFDTSAKSWDEVAVARAYEIADAMIKEREISNV